jgi:hypothetical protein
MLIDPNKVDDGPNLLVNAVKLLIVVVPLWLIITFLRRKRGGKMKPVTGEPARKPE